MTLRYIERIRHTFPVDINTYCKEYNQHNMGLEKKKMIKRLQTERIRPTSTKGKHDI